MARNRDTVKPVEFHSEEDYEEGDSQESDSEPEQTHTAMTKKSQPQMAAKSQQAPPQKVPSSSEEEESGSETDSESEGPDSNANASPLVSKPMEVTQKSSNAATKARSKPKEPERVTPTKSAAAKRPAEDTPKDAKKSKITDASETSEKKSNLFQRLWSEDDEIVILRGIIDFTSKNKSDPLSDLTVFLDFIKNKLSIDVSRSQLQDKIKRLKKKYENIKSKMKKGKERTFSKPHEQKAYDLSKVIWGNESGKGKRSQANAGECKEAEGTKSPVLHFDSVGATMEERMLIAGGDLFGLGHVADGGHDWQKLKLEEMELYLKVLKLRTSQTKLVVEAMKAGDC